MDWDAHHGQVSQYGHHGHGGHHDHRGNCTSGKGAGTTRQGNHTQDEQERMSTEQLFADLFPNKKII